MSIEQTPTVTGRLFAASWESDNVFVINVPDNERWSIVAVSGIKFLTAPDGGYILQGDINGVYFMWDTTVLVTPLSIDFLGELSPTIALPGDILTFTGTIDDARVDFQVIVDVTWDARPSLP